jgi:hypothetical protein
MAPAILMDSAMTIPARNIRRPSSPIRREGYPENRVFQNVGGVRIKVGSVITVGNTGPFENWWSLARAHQVRPWEIIRLNFDTDVPEEVNWYLREYVGCHRLGPRGRNYCFEDARPGLILMPWGDAVNQILVAEEKKSKNREDRLDERWPDRKSDIIAGRQLVSDMLRRTHREIVRWKPNPLDFNFEQELKDMIFTVSLPDTEKAGKSEFMPVPGWGDLVQAVLKTFNESHPANQAVRRIRQDIHSAFASGVANSLFPASMHSMDGRSGYARVFFDKGRDYGSSLTQEQRYQFCLGLAENERHGGLAGFEPLDEGKSFYRARITDGGVERLIKREFSRKMYWFSN